MNNILDVKNLKKVYHTKEGEIEAVLDVSFSVQQGEFISIVGPSGCGKSTILSMLTNLEEKSGGEMSIPDSIRIGYMLQTDSLFPWLSILDNAILGLKITKEDTIENIAYVKNLLETYGLKEFEMKYPSELSGGMKQRVV